MLVSALQDTALFTIISDDSVSDSCLHNLLYECAQNMLDKYELKKKGSKKLEIKTSAVKEMLIELSKVPKDSCATRATILSALERHVQALQGYEHLLSTKGNTYALMKQTQGLRKTDNPANSPASLLRYHDLKDNLLNNLCISDKHKAVLYELDESKSLTLKVLEALDAYPFRTMWILVNLHAADLLDPDLYEKVFEHEKPLDVANALMRLKKYGLLEADGRHLYDEILECEDPIMLTTTFYRLNKSKLLGLGLFIELHKHPTHFLAALTVEGLHEAGVVNPFVYHAVISHTDLERATGAIVKLAENKLDKSDDNCLVVLNQEDPYNAALVIINLRSCGLLTVENRNKVFKHKQPGLVTDALGHLGKALCTPGNLDALVNHPHIGDLTSEISRLEEIGKLDQSSFERCLRKTGSVVKT